MGDRVVGSGAGRMEWWGLMEGEGLVLALITIHEAWCLCCRSSHCFHRVLIMYPCHHVLVVTLSSHGLIILSSLCCCCLILLLCCCHLVLSLGCGCTSLSLSHTMNNDE